MKQFRLVASVLALLLCAGFVMAQTHGQKPEAVANSYIVVLKAGFNPQDVAESTARFYGGNVEFVYTKALRGFSIHVPVGVDDVSLLTDPRVDYVEPDYVVKLPPYRIDSPPPGHGPGSGGGGGGSNTQPPQVIPSGMVRIGLDPNAAAAYTNNKVDVAILDTGIDLDHPDLNVVFGIDFSGGKSADDKNGHGTHVAGTVGAINNSIGVVGVAPGARLYAIKVLGNGGTGSMSGVIAGIDWVTTNAATIDVANMSLSGTGKSNALRQALQNSEAAGVVYAVAAGNSDIDIYGSNQVFDGALDSTSGDDVIPAAYPEVGTVSAMYDANDTFASFSNYSVADQIDLAAPGVYILSTWKGGGYNTISGTSMSSPHVAGAYALYIAIHGRSTPANVRSALMSLAEYGWNTGSSPDGIDEGLLDVRTLK